MDFCYVGGIYKLRGENTAFIRWIKVVLEGRYGDTRLLRRYEATKRPFRVVDGRRLSVRLFVCQTRNVRFYANVCGNTREVSGVAAVS